MKKIVLLAFVLVLLSTAVVERFARPVVAKTYYLSVGVGDWAEYRVEEAPDECWARANALKLGDRLKFLIFDKNITSFDDVEREYALFYVYLNGEKIHETSAEFPFLDIYVLGFTHIAINPFNPVDEDYWREIDSSKCTFSDSKIIYTTQVNNGTYKDTVHKNSGITLEYEIFGLYMCLSATSVPDVIALPPLWVQWWFWAIVAAGIVALAVTVYFLKKRKPPTPTAPTLPTEGILQNIHSAYGCHSHLQTKTTQNTNSLTIRVPSFF